MTCKAIAIAFLIVAAAAPAWPRLDSEKAMYVGGTVTGLKEGSVGECSTADEKLFAFVSPGGKVTIPYDRVNSLEYGQKAGRRVGLAIAVTPLTLLSKKRRHFLTLGYLDDNEKQQAAIFEVGKNKVRVILTTLEARTGRKIEYQDEESRKRGLGN